MEELNELIIDDDRNEGHGLLNGAVRRRVNPFCAFCTWVWSCFGLRVSSAAPVVDLEAGAPLVNHHAANAPNIFSRVLQFCCCGAPANDGVNGAPLNPDGGNGANLNPAAGNGANLNPAAGNGANLNPAAGNDANLNPASPNIFLRVFCCCFGSHANNGGNGADPPVNNGADPPINADVWGDFLKDANTFVQWMLSTVFLFVPAKLLVAIAKLLVA